MKEKPNFYAVIPATVRYDETLSSSQKLFYAEITAMSQKEGFCWASNSYFSKLYGVASSTVSSWVTGLKDNGHVVVEYEKTGKNIDKRLIYPIQKIEYPYSENQKPPIQKNGIPYSENTKENNTSNNNTSSNNTSISRDGEKFINGSPVPESLQDEEILKSYEFYCQYMKENFNRWPTSTTTQLDLHKLTELQHEGNDPVKVIQQTIQSRNKSFYELRNFKKDKKTVNAKDLDF